MKTKASTILLFAAPAILGLASCGGTDTPASTKDTESTGTSASVRTDVFDKQTVFHLDAASVPTFGPGFASNTITFEPDGTFKNDYTLSAAGVALVNIFMDNEGTYSLNSDKTKLTMNVVFSAINNQQPDKAEERVDVEYELRTLEDGSYQFSTIFNEKLEMPYYTNPEMFESLKEFEYPEALGEKVVFDISQSFVGYVDELDPSPYGQITAYSIEFADDGQYTQSITLQGKDTTNTLTSKGAYKLDSAENPTAVKLLEEKKDEIVEYQMAKVVAEGEDPYFTMTFSNPAFGTFLAYSDIDKVPSRIVYPESLGTLNPFEKKTVFEGASATFGAIQYTFFHNGASKMDVPAFSASFPGYYNLSADGTKITLLDEGEGKTANTYDLAVSADGVRSFVYTANAAAGTVTLTEIVK